MLRNRPRTVPSSKQALMADPHQCHNTSQAPNSTTRPISSFLGSPRFRAFTTKGLSETTDSSTIMMMSPTSTLDSKQFFPLIRIPNQNPFLITQKQPKSPETVSENRHSWDKLDSRGIGLALIDTLISEDPVDENCSKPSNTKVLFGSKLRVQIPPKNTHQDPPSPSPPQVFTLKEMELSEDYTCVISHGPNPRTTHIFDNCIVESYSCVFSDKSSSCSPKNKIISFLSFCHTCNKNLEQKNDIYIYRGEKAFCSNECRNQEMLLDGVENSESEDNSRRI